MNALTCTLRDCSVLRLRLHILFTAFLFSSLFVFASHAQEWYHNGPSSVYARTIEVCPYDTTKMFIGTNARGIFFTEDGGQTWLERNQNISTAQDTAYDFNAYEQNWWDGEYETVKEIWIDPYHEGSVWASTAHYVYMMNQDSTGIISTYVSTLLHSPDYGEHWLPRDTGVIDSTVYTNMAFDEDERTIYLICDEAFYSTTNLGLSWSQVEGLSECDSFYGLTVASDGCVYVSGSENCYGALFSKEVGSDDWELISETGITRLHSHPSDPQQLWGNQRISIGDNSPLLASFDGGCTWQNHSGVLLDIAADGTIYNSYNGTLMRSTDAGETWEPIFEDIDNYNGRFGFGVNPVNGSTVYYSCPAGLLVSYDQGETHEHFDQGLDNSYIQRIVAHPSDPQTAYAAGETGLWKTEDGGASWQRQIDGKLSFISIDPLHPDTVYASGDFLFRSFNGGESWEYIEVSCRQDPYAETWTAVAVHPVETSNVYVMSQHSSTYIERLYVSEDCLSTFSDSSDRNLDYPEPPPYLEFDSADPPALYMGRMYWSEDIHEWDVFTAGPGLPEGFAHVPGSRLFAMSGCTHYDPNYRYEFGVYFSDDRWESYSDATGELDANGVWDVEFGPGNMLAVATTEGVLTRYPDTEWTRLDGPYDNRCNTLAFSCDGSILYVGTHGYGIYAGYHVVGVDEKDVDAQPTTSALLSCYPNPANSGVQVCYRLDTRSPVTITVYNVLGKRVRTLAEQVQEAGEHRVYWDGVSDKSFPVSTGVYFVSLSMDGRNLTRKVLLLK